MLEPGLRNRRICGACCLLPAVVYCLQCQKDICTNCHDGHHQKYEAPRHTIVRVQNIPQCNIHNTPCTHACRRCRRFVCAQCLDGDCSDHHYSEIGMAVREAITSGKFKNILQNSEKILQNYEANLSEINQNIAVAEQELQTHTDLVMHGLLGECQRLKSELQDMKKAALEKMELSYMSAQEIRAKLAPVIEAKPDDLWKEIPAYMLPAIWLDSQNGDEPSDSTGPVKNAGKVWYKQKFPAANMHLGDFTTEPRPRPSSVIPHRLIIVFCVLCFLAVLIKSFSTQMEHSSRRAHYRYWKRFQRCWCDLWEASYSYLNKNDVVCIFWDFHLCILLRDYTRIRWFYSNITLPSWRLKTPTMLLFVQHVFRASNKANTKVSYYRPFEGRIRMSPVDSPHKGSLMQKGYHVMMS